MWRDLGLTPDARYPEERQDRRRRDGQLSPARRQLDLRRDGPPLAVVGHAHSRSSTGRETSAPPTVTAPPRIDTPKRSSSPPPSSCSPSSRSAPSRGGPSYDGTKSEPVVLPARIPHLLINGSQGIAVGMATSIPPHNPTEVIEACIAQIEAGKDDPADQDSAEARQGARLPHRRPAHGVARRARADLRDGLGLAQAPRRVEARREEGRHSPPSSSPRCPTAWFAARWSSASPRSS